MHARRSKRRKGRCSHFEERKSEGVCSPRTSSIFSVSLPRRASASCRAPSSPTLLTGGAGEQRGAGVRQGGQARVLGTKGGAGEGSREIATHSEGAAPSGPLGCAARPPGGARPRPRRRSLGARGGGKEGMGRGGGARCMHAMSARSWGGGEIKRQRRGQSGRDPAAGTRAAGGRAMGNPAGGSQEGVQKRAQGTIPHFQAAASSAWCCPAARKTGAGRPRPRGWCLGGASASKRGGEGET